MTINELRPLLFSNCLKMTCIKSLSGFALLHNLSVLGSYPEFMHTFSGSKNPGAPNQKTIYKLL